MYWLSQRNLPDLIIVDAQLPDMNNWELIEQLSSSGLYSGIPIIVLSSLDKGETMAKCFEYGISYSFNKPFNPIELMDAVDTICENPKLKRAHTAPLN